MPTACGQARAGWLAVARDSKALMPGIRVPSRVKRPVMPMAFSRTIVGMLIVMAAEVRCRFLLWVQNDGWRRVCETSRERTCRKKCNRVSLNYILASADNGHKGLMPVVSCLPNHIVRFTSAHESCAPTSRTCRYVCGKLRRYHVDTFGFFVEGDIARFV